MGIANGAGRMYCINQRTKPKMNRFISATTLIILPMLTGQAFGSDTHIKAYLTLQKPYRECIKTEMKQRYEMLVSQCIEKQKAAKLEDCQLKSEKQANLDSAKKDFGQHCNKLKPSKAEFDRYLKELQADPAETKN